MSEPDKIYVNQLINLIKYGQKKNKQFLKNIMTLDTMDSRFDVLDGRVAFTREPDDNMTLEKFLEEMKRPYITLQINSPTPYVIRYCASFETREGRHTISHFAWSECAYNDENFSKVGKLYLDVFKRTLENEPIPAGLKEYFEEHKNSFSH